MALLLLGLALVGVAFAVAGRALVMSRRRMVASVSGIERYGFTSTAGVDDRQSRSSLQDLASFVGETLGGRLGGLRESELRQHLVSAGMYSLSPRMLYGYQVLAAAGLGAIWLWLSIASGMKVLTVVAGAAILIASGWIAPVSIVRRRARERLAEIDYAVPELIDLLVVSVEAGVGFAGSLRGASERMQGALGAELRLATQEQRMGLSPTDALENLLGRCPTDTVRSFVRTIVEGERLGVSVGQIMRNLAVDMRKRRRQMAEERAHKAPVKLVFPLVFLIFPAVFVVLLGPAMFQILDSLKK
ncbi:MAG TPA: type II secretion system F family protein [Gaiellaceae bacterium]|nr:type II secretion system F family protein [Gaiellaceae bacterium]